MSSLPTEYADLPDIRVAYTQYGSGRILILLHGNSESKRIFNEYQLNSFPHVYYARNRQPWAWRIQIER